MSIINDALRKAQESLKKKQQKENITYNEISADQKQAPKPEQKLPQQSFVSQAQKRPEFRSAPRAQTQSSSQPQPHAPNTKPVKTTTEYVNNKKPWYKSNTAVTLVSLLFIGTLSAGLYAMLKQSNIQKKILPSASTPSQQKTILNKNQALPKTAQSNTLKLSGTTMMGSKRVALINEEIYEVGDNVAGRQIISINLDKVELMENGNIITLRVGKY